MNRKASLFLHPIQEDVELTKGFIKYDSFEDQLASTPIWVNSPSSSINSDTSEVLGTPSFLDIVLNIDSGANSKSECECCGDEYEETIFLEVDWGHGICASCTRALSDLEDNTITIDHQQEFDKCVGCQESIRGPCLLAMYSHWHLDHFKCHHCRCSLGGKEGFVERDGRAYCVRDYAALFLPQCVGCSGPIIESYVSALGGEWHKECFGCYRCGEAIESNQGFIIGEQLYCSCCNSERTSCRLCPKPISGLCLASSKSKFHPQHFQCGQCLQSLPPIGFSGIKGEFTCSYCASLP